MTRVLVVADILLYREGLALILEREPGFGPVAAVAGVPAGLRAYRRLEPDVVLVDAASRGAHEIVRALVAAEPDMRVVVLGVEETEDEVMEYAEVGVVGYVTRQADRRTLRETLETVAAGGSLCSPQITAALLRRVAALSTSSASTNGTSKLTVREREIVELMQEGLSNKEIAQRLCIEVATVKNHVHNILDKLGVRRRGQVAAVLRSST